MKSFEDFIAVSLFNNSHVQKAFSLGLDMMLAPLPFHGFPKAYKEIFDMVKQFMDSKAEEDVYVEVARDFVKTLVGEEGWTSFQQVPLWSHHFLILEADDGSYYSLDKFCDFIDIRRSFDKELLISYKLGNSGKDERKLGRVTGSPHIPSKTIRMSHVHDWMVEEVGQKYNVLLNNCQSFSTRLWNAFKAGEYPRGYKEEL